MMGPGRALEGLVQRHERAAVTFAVTLGGFAILSFVRADGRFWPFFTVLLVLAAITGAVDARVRFTRTVGWMLVVLGALHLCGGLLPPLSGPTFYETWLVPGVLKFDQLVHAYGSFVGTIVAWQVLGAYIDPERTPVRAHAWLAAGVALGKGALNEVIEFIASQNTSGLYIGDALNSQWDLVFNVAGVTFAFIVLRAGLVDRHTRHAVASTPSTSRKNRPV